MDFKWAQFGITMNDSIRLASALKLSNITNLRIYSSGIDDEKCRVLCNSLLNLKTLQHLDFSHNNIGDYGARGVAKLILTNQIETLILSNNEIGVEGGVVFGKALSKNQHLKHLELSLNSLQDEGASKLIDGLLHNKSLCKLGLAGNGLGSNSVVAVASILKLNKPELFYVDLSCNKLENNLQRPDDLRLEQHLTIGGVDAAGKLLMEAISTNKVSNFNLVCYQF
jgi:Ran GTPase-activating protein (RanGAP) involved in mRNA processing and transport